MNFYLNKDWSIVTCNGEEEVYPKDWVKNNILSNLSSIAKIKGGKAFLAKNFVNTGYGKVIKIKNVGFGNIRYDNLSYISKEDSDKSSDFLLQPEDIIISMTGSSFNAPNSLVGRVAIVTENDINCYINQRVGILKFVVPASKNFWFYFMSLKKNQHFLAKNASGSANQVNISNDLIESLNIPLISLTEQVAIASILSKQDSIVKKTKRLLDELEKRHQFISEELLTGRLRIKKENENFLFYKNPRDNFIDCDLNREKTIIPKGWNTIFLGAKKIPFIKSGVKKYNGGIDYYATGEVKDFSLGSNPTGNFSYHEKPSRANLRVLDNSIYFARMKDTLKIIKFEKNENILLSTGFLGLQPNISEVMLDFLYYVIQSNNFQKIKNKECKGSTQESLSDGSAGKIEILLPHVEEQALIAKVLNIMFVEKENYKKILIEEEKTFKFLLEELMSGRLRIKI